MRQERTESAQEQRIAYLKAITPPPPPPPLRSRRRPPPLRPRRQPRRRRRRPPPPTTTAAAAAATTTTSTTTTTTTITITTTTTTNNNNNLSMCNCFYRLFSWGEQQQLLIIMHIFVSLGENQNNDEDERSRKAEIRKVEFLLQFSSDHLGMVCMRSGKKPYALPTRLSEDSPTLLSNTAPLLI